MHHCLGFVHRCINHNAREYGMVVCKKVSLHTPSCCFQGLDHNSLFYRNNNEDYIYIYFRRVNIHIICVICCILTTIEINLQTYLRSSERKIIS